MTEDGHIVPRVLPKCRAQVTPKLEFCFRPLSCRFSGISRLEAAALPGAPSPSLSTEVHPRPGDGRKPHVGRARKGSWPRRDPRPDPQSPRTATTPAAVDPVSTALAPPRGSRTPNLCGGLWGTSAAWGLGADGRWGCSRSRKSLRLAVRKFTDHRPTDSSAGGRKWPASPGRFDKTGKPLKICTPRATAGRGGRGDVSGGGGQSSQTRVSAAEAEGQTDARADVPVA